ncbi:peptide ABC transporter substrate-binding protein [Caproicibacterium lactatifermentans]|nr:peptide ABC transporter substrate-binding protein [Caproicibacterium lactatifermentans]
MKKRISGSSTPAWKKRLFRAAAFLLAAVMAGSMAGCGSSAGSAAASAASTRYPGTSAANSVTINVPNEPPELNSMLTTDQVSGDVLRLTVSGLTKQDANDTPQPDIAKSWDISADKKTYTFHLRKDAKWSNGEPVKAKDFVFSWLTAMTASTGAQYAYILTDNIAGGQEYYDKKITADKVGVKALDDYTLKVEFKNPIPYALSLTSFFAYLPINEKGYKQITGSNADKYGKSPQTLLTNGPYKMTEWTHDDHVTLVKNNDYWDAAKTTIPNVKLTMLKDENAMMNAFKAGSVDEVTVNGDQMAAMKAEGEPVHTYSDGGTVYLEYNVKRTKLGLNNAKIRKALGMALDTAKMCTNVLKDGSTAATGVVPTAIAGANGSYDKARGTVIAGYDKAKAKALFEDGLKETGLSKNDLKIPLVSSDDSKAQKITAYLQQQWSDALGITVELKPMPSKSRFAAMSAGDFDMVLTNWFPDYNDPMTYLDTLVTTNGNNNGKYSSKQYDTLIQQATAEADAAKRQNILIQAEKLMMDDCPIYPLYFKAQCYVTSGKFTGLTRTAFQDIDLCDGAKVS